jgi:hypothetical protein
VSGKPSFEFIARELNSQDIASKKMSLALDSSEKVPNK